MDTPAPPVPAPVSPFWVFLCRLRIVAIVLFVCWHLFFLLFRNVVDLWEAELITHGVKKWDGWTVPLLRMHQNFPNDPRGVDLSLGTVYSTIDMATWRYGNYFGIEQGWSMFSPPIARRAPFLGAEVELNDGAREQLLSPNEFPLGGYFRWDGWRQRKLEDYLVFETPETIPNKSDPQIFEAYIRWTVRRWKAANPGDPREVMRVRLLKRNWTLPGPSEDPQSHKLEETLVGVFTPAGVLERGGEK